MADPDKPLASTDGAPPVTPPPVEPAISEVRLTEPLPPLGALASEQREPVQPAAEALSRPPTPQGAVTEPVLATAPQAESDTAPHLPMQPDPPQDPAPLPEPLISPQPALPVQPPQPKLPGTGGGIGSRTAAGEAPAQSKASTGTQPAAKGAGGGAKYRQMAAKYFFPLFAFFALVAYVVATFWPIGKTGSALEMATAVTLAVFMGALALWFIHCMTGKADDEKVESLFVFAYAFTFGAFALLLVPVLSDQFSTAAARSDAAKPVRPHDEGALRLVRGCVRADAEGSRTLGLKLAPCPVEPPASAPRLPDGIETTSVRYAWLVSVGGVTARTLAFDECEYAKGKSADRAGQRDEAEPAALAVGASTESKDSFARLKDRAAQAVKHADAACLAQRGDDPTKPFVEVSGGIAVPLFVVVMALIGGAVSISRRIPEIQRRSDPQYVSTEKEPFMPHYRVREGVVFQIMQLISAPFLAIATMQVIEPNTLASASTLAFATGFFSETILYMIRGVVEGLKPEVTKVAGPVMTNLVGQLVWQDPADPGDFTKVRVELQSERPVEWRNGPVDSQGKFAINGVTTGRYRLVIGGSGIKPVPPQDIEVDDKQPGIINVAVTKAARPVMTDLVGQLVWQDSTDPGDFAKVRVELQSDRPVEWRNLPVDSEGKFAINGVAAGRYRLVIGGSGIKPITQDIEVNDQPPAIINIAVTKS